MSRLGPLSASHLVVTATLAALLLFVWPSLATAQLACGGHYIEYLGGPSTATPGFRQHGPPTISEPSGMTAQDRELWDALIFDAYDHPTPSPDAEDAWRSSLSLEERHTFVMDTGDATLFRLCIQAADESYTGQRLDRHTDPDWWRREVQRFTNHRWAGTIEVGTCTGDPPMGWVYVRGGDPGEVDDHVYAYARSWWSHNSHDTIETWVKSEIVFNPEPPARGDNEAFFEDELAHELGHVLGLSHVPPSSGFVMVSGTLSTRPDQESRLAQWAHQVGPGIEYPGFALPDPDPDPDPVQLEVDIVGVPEVAVAGESYELTAQSDAEALVYAWRVDSGTIEPDDAHTVVWTAPETAGVAWIHVDVTREDGATAGQSAYVRVEVPDAEPESEPEPVPALPLLGQLLLALGLAGAGARLLSRRSRVPHRGGRRRRVS